jgi:hypothetical protein
MGVATIAAVTAAAASVYSANQQKQAAKGAANAQTNAANSAIGQTEQNYQRTATNLNPYITSGQNALGTINALNSGDYSSFHASPDYQFSLSQGLQGLDRSAAARGSLYSGGQTADTLNYAEGLANQNYNNYYSKLADLAGMGQSAASNLGSIGTGNAAAIGNYLTNAGEAAANGAINSANASSNMTSQLGQLAGQYASSYQWNTNPDNPYGPNYMPQLNTSYGTPSYTGNALSNPGVKVGDIQFGNALALYK